MSSQALPPLAAVWLLTRLRLRRQLNFFGSAMQRKRKGADGTRSGSAPKAGKGLLIGLGLALMMLIWVGIYSHQAALHFTCTGVESCRIGQFDRTMGEAMSGILDARYMAPVLAGFAWLVFLLVLTCILVPLGSTELTQDWDLEWLATLPLPRSVLLAARVVERSVVNSVAVLTIWPMLTVLAWHGGWRFWSPLVALLPTCLMLLLSGAGRALGDTGLRMLLSPAGLRNMQAVLSIAGIPSMLLAMAYGLPRTIPFAYDILRALPDAFLWTPFSLAAQSVYAPTAAQSFSALALCALFTLTIVGTAIATLAWMLRDGINPGGAREAGRGAAAPSRRRFGSAVVWREVTLLKRDRNFLVQTLVLPVLMIGTQLMLNGPQGGASQLAASPSFVASIAFGLTAYVLMQSAFQTVNAEGGALWILYTVPRALVSVLRAKMVFWAIVGCVYALPAFVMAAWLNGGVSLELLGMAVLVLAGVPIYTAIAGSLGIFGCNPLSEDRRHRVRPTFVYLYFLLSGFFTYALFEPSVWRKLVVVGFSAGLAISLWQKAQDRLPYLLDPAASPPARISTADGMIGAMAFMVLQGLIQMIMVAVTKQQQLDWSMLAMSFGGAGAITFIGLRLVYWKRTEGVPRLWPERPAMAVALGLAAGACALAAALLYLWFVRPATPPAVPGHYAWFALLAIVMAPLAEEFIFRGLLYGGLRRSYPEWLSVVVSSALFAALHPPAAFPAVFGLGVACALVYRQTGTLLAPILAHALYNGLLVVFAAT